LSEFGISQLPPVTVDPQSKVPEPSLLFRLSDATGAITFELATPVAFSTLASDDVFLFDAACYTNPAIYVWIGKGSSRLERRLALQYGQNYLHQKLADKGNVQVAVSLVKLTEGEESAAFKKAIGA
jgi:gelsolin